MGGRYMQLQVVHDQQVSQINCAHALAMDNVARLGGLAITGSAGRTSHDVPGIGKAEHD